MSKGRTIYFDIINIIACFSVIALHHNGLVHNFQPTSSWNQALIIEVICYCAVPLFFMLSGATLLNYEERYSIKQYFSQRIRRVLLPFFIWTVLWGIATRQIFHTTCVVDFLNAVISSRFCGIFWFFIPLFGLYLLIPLLASIRKSQTLHLYAIGLFFVLGSLLPLINKLCGIYESALSDDSLMYVCMYALLGDYLHRYDIEKRLFYGVLLVAFFCLITRYCVTYHFSYETGRTYRLLFSYSYFTAVFPAIAMFLVCKKLKTASLSTKCVYRLQALSRCSFGVYLIHFAFVGILWPKVFSCINISTESFIYRIILVPVTYLICVLIVYVCKKYRITRWLFP